MYCTLQAPRKNSRVLSRCTYVIRKRTAPCQDVGTLQQDANLQRLNSVRSSVFLWRRTRWGTFDFRWIIGWHPLSTLLTSWTTAYHPDRRTRPRQVRRWTLSHLQTILLRSSTHVGQADRDSGRVVVLSHHFSDPIVHVCWRTPSVHVFVSTVVGKP